MASPQTARRGTGQRYSEGQVEAAVVNYNRLAAAFLNRAIPRGALLPAVAQATDPLKIKLTNAVDYCIDGAWNAKAATDPLWTLTGSLLQGSVQFPNAWRKYLLLLDSAGVASVYSSGDIFAPSGDPLTGTVTGTNRCSWNLGLLAGTALPWDGKAIIGYYQVNANSNSFTPNGTTTNGGGILGQFNDGVDPYLIQQIANEAVQVASSNLY
jgi:hypothetical protein